MTDLQKQRGTLDFRKDDKHINKPWNVASITLCTLENVLSVVTYAAVSLSGCVFSSRSIISEIFWCFVDVRLFRSVSDCSSLAENRLLCHTWAAGYFITAFAVRWHSPSPHHNSSCQHTLIQRATITHESDDVGGRPIDDAEQCDSKYIAEGQKGSRKKSARRKEVEILTHDLSSASFDRLLLEKEVTLNWTFPINWFSEWHKKGCLSFWLSSRWQVCQIN